LFGLYEKGTPTEAEYTKLLSYVVKIMKKVTSTLKLWGWEAPHYGYHAKEDWGGEDTLSQNDDRGIGYFRENNLSD